MKRAIALTSLLLVAVASIWFAAAPAGAGGACKKAKPATPHSVSSNAADAPKERVIQVTDKATEDKPIVLEYSHAPAFADQSVGEATTGDPSSTMIVEDARFFNFQLATGDKRGASVNSRIEWSSPSPSDIDLRLYGGGGAEIDYSAAYNPAYPAYGQVSGGDDDNGMEQLLGIVMPRCYSFTVESRPASSPGEDAVTLKVWLD